MGEGDFEREPGIRDIRPESARLDPAVTFADAIGLLAGKEWEGVRKLIPNLPAMDISPREFMDLIAKRNPYVEVRVSMDRDKHPGEVRSKLYKE